VNDERFGMSATTVFYDAVCPECQSKVLFKELPKHGGFMQVDGLDPKELICENGHTFGVKPGEGGNVVPRAPITGG
jgi:DNA-directed RNA polymerase subunit RPC12/RpoP